MTASPSWPRRQLHQAVAEALEASAPEDLPALYARLAWHWARAEAPADDAERQARAACGALRKYASVFPIARPRSLVCDGLLASRVGHPLRALRSMRRGLAEGRRLGMPYEEALALQHLGRALPGDEGRDAARRAAALFERLGCRRPAW